jgi:hypothetical protein
MLTMYTSFATDVSKYPVSQQHKGPSVPKQVEDIDRFFQRSRRQHAELFHNVRLREKWCKPKEQGKGDEKPVAQQFFHEFPRQG